MLYTPECRSTLKAYATCGDMLIHLHVAILGQKCPKLGGAIFLVRGKGTVLAPLAMAAASSAQARVNEQLDQSWDYLAKCGFGPEELATMDWTECQEAAKQMASELAFPAIWTWVEEAREEVKLLRRARGLFQPGLTWRELIPLPEVPEVIAATAPDPAPPKGDRNRKLLAEGALNEAREERLQSYWTSRLRLELESSEAPVLKKLQGSLDRPRRLPGR